jgi:adenylate kinase family enzyme
LVPERGLLHPPAVHTFIVGNSGSGKSTLARRLAEERGLVHLDLDQYAWTDALGVRRDLEKSLAVLQPILAEAPTVLEGMYGDIVAGLLRPDDRLIWLDLPLSECEAHCRARPFEPHKWESAEKQNAFLPQLLSFLGSYAEREDGLGAKTHARIFEAHIGAKTRVLSADEAGRLEATA